MSSLVGIMHAVSIMTSHKPKGSELSIIAVYVNEWGGVGGLERILLRNSAPATRTDRAHISRLSPSFIISYIFYYATAIISL